MPSTATQKPLRILFADAIRIWGGAQRFILETAEGLAARGHEVTIQTFPDSNLAERARKRGIAVNEVRTRADSAPWTVLPLAARMRRRPYDVVVTTFDKDLRTTGLAARLAGRHQRGRCRAPCQLTGLRRWLR